MNDKFNQIDTKEIDLPETTFSRDVESRVFQAIVLQCLTKIEGIALVGGSLIDSLLGREAHERYSGINIEQDNKQHSVTIKIEINIKYGLSIPEKAEEIQSKVIEEISKFTGLHVSTVHVVFKNLILDTKQQEELDSLEEEAEVTAPDDEYEGF
ncbi:MAG: Asp23/Gls24 family envelope stress response protein [Parachlamydiales bacterium]|nr:Asp23/Gls24 family envelope stress response protein [Parachlamydiales bacterium]